MKCFLLAAGLGTRLRPLTDRLPKCLLPIRGRPLLAIWLDQLSRHGVREVVINTHWQSAKVEDFVRSRPESRPKVRTAYESDLLGSAGTLWHHRDWLEAGESFFVIYADVLTKMDLSRMVAAHRRHGAPFTMGLFRTDHPQACGIASVARTGDIIAFEEKPQQPLSFWAAAGVYLSDTRLFDYYPRPLDGPLDLGLHILPRMVGHMKAFFIEEMLIDIGTPDAYRKAQRMWTDGT